MLQLSLFRLAKSGLLLLFLLGATLSLLPAQAIYNAEASLELVMPEGSGRNGASVAWHPGNYCYYAA